MEFKYGFSVSNYIVNNELKKITNQIYKLLPCREEGKDWQKPLETLLEELAGINRLYILKEDVLFPLIAKLEGLNSLTDENSFLTFRRIIFECLGLINKLQL